MKWPHEESEKSTGIATIRTHASVLGILPALFIRVLLHVFCPVSLSPHEEPEQCTGTIQALRTHMTVGTLFLLTVITVNRMLSCLYPMFR
jgi:hypothetical protein